MRQGSGFQTTVRLLLMLFVASPAAFGSEKMKLNMETGGAASGPFWESDAMAGEPLLFVRKAGQSTAEASLLFTPAGEPRIANHDGTMIYEKGRDYLWRPGSRDIRLAENSRIPFKTEEEMHPPAGSPHSIPSAAGGKSDLFVAEGGALHEVQALAFYPHGEAWTGFRLPRKGGLLPRTLSRLVAGEPLRVVVLGDSISAGFSASGFAKPAPYDAPRAKSAPFQEPYAGLVAGGLEKRFGSKISLINLSAAGTHSAWGADMAANAAAEKPDLMIVAFGMKDAAGVAPEAFTQNIRAILSAARKTNPDAEFILVAPMTGNAEWAALRQELFPKFRDELLKLEASGIAVADVTSLWLDLLKRKKFLDLTGNGVNHPNDFGHRVYAEVILQLLKPL